MDTKGGRLPALVMLLCLPGWLPAAEAPSRCRELFDDGARLACYDAQFGKPSRPVIAPAPAPAPTAPQRQAPPAPPPQARVEPASPPSAPGAADEKPREENISAKITRVARVANDRFQITLDNGQAWVQLERDPAATVAVGDTVKIRRALMGSWMLETPAGVRTRVRQSP